VQADNDKAQISCYLIEFIGTKILFVKDHWLLEANPGETSVIPERTSVFHGGANEDKGDTSYFPEHTSENPGHTSGITGRISEDTQRTNVFPSYTSKVT
jgi:hypothetical protein